MSTDEPTGSPEPEEAAAWPLGLRERKKRLTRSLISDTATAMFLERGFDDVKVSEIAEACGVSEKTVYNYFPTKESLMLDREPEAAAALWRALGPGASDRPPVAAFVELLEAQIHEMHDNWVTDGMASFRRFSELIDATPSLQTAQLEMADRLERTAAEALAERAGVSPDDPEPRIAAVALMGLFRMLYEDARRCALEEVAPDEALRIVTEDFRRAARVVESGLWMFGPGEGRPSRQQLKAAADSAQLAGRQVVTAIRQARAAWQEMQREGGGHQRGAGAEGQAAFAALLEQSEQWKREFRDQQDEWKRAYREQQWQLRQAQREIQQRFRQANQQRQQAVPGARRMRGGPGTNTGSDDQPL